MTRVERSWISTIAPFLELARALQIFAMGCVACQ
jgi:hypothetical protein